MLEHEEKKVKIAMKRSPSVNKRQAEQRPKDNRVSEVVEIVAQNTEQPVALDVYPY